MPETINATNATNINTNPCYHLCAQRASAAKAQSSQKGFSLEFVDNDGIESWWTFTKDSDFTGHMHSSDLHLLPSVDVIDSTAPVAATRISPLRGQNIFAILSSVNRPAIPKGARE